MTATREVDTSLKSSGRLSTIVPLDEANELRINELDNGHLELRVLTLGRETRHAVYIPENSLDYLTKSLAQVKSRQRIFVYILVVNLLLPIFLFMAYYYRGNT